MKHYFFCLFTFVIGNLQAQALRDINFEYLYNPSDFTFNMKPVRSGQTWQVDFVLQLRDTTKTISTYQISWEIRKSLAEKSGQPLAESDSANWEIKRTYVTGKIARAVSAEPEIIVARVTNLAIRQAWYFYHILEPNYPVIYSLRANGKAAVNGYVKTSESFTVTGAEGNLTVSYYNDDFPTSLPPFSETQGRVSKAMRVDSTFTLSTSGPASFSKKGLYLLQQDTMATTGVAIRAEEDYPKLSRIKSLAGPMVYICSKQEYDRLSGPKVEKKQFDRVILSITNDTERAKKLIRNYFKRVEMANLLFTSYKEGWKTDRGMAYIIFGPPQELYKFQDRELWYYQTEYYKINFTFVKTPSLFDPENYVLIRDRKFQQTWYEVIDLWRNARF